MSPKGRRRSVPDPFARRWPKITLIAACLAVPAAGWWFYGHDAGRQGDETIPPGARAGEAPAQQAAKPAELRQALQQAEWLSTAYRESLEKERRRNTELEQELANDHQLLAQERERSKGIEQQLAARQSDQESSAQERVRIKGLEEQLAARQNDQQLLAQERERNRGLQQQLAALQPSQELLAQERDRIKELEHQLAASRQLPPVLNPMTDPDPRNATPTYRPPEAIIKPQPIVRRTGARPLPKVTQPMPQFSLQASDLTYNPARYWQVTVTLTSNTSRTLDAQVRCSFLSAERSVGEASFGPTAVAPGEQISADLIGPPMTAYVDSTTCRVVGQ
jgi:hypothetical protein